jgi:bla regulator protein blaR1
MAAFAYSFCLALLHSIWQCGLLALCYWVFTKIYRQLAPQANRNLLFFTLVAQVALFVFTFTIIYLNLHFATAFSSILITEYLPVIDDSSILYQTLLTTYIFVVFFKLTGTLYKWQKFKYEIKKSLSKPPIDIRLFTTTKALHLGIKQKVQIWYSNTVSSPLTFGFFKPIILLPISLVNHISIQQTEAILLHELAHIKANDYFTNWFITIVEIIFFFNPFILSFCKKIRLQRELYCDSLVLQYNYSPIVYAEALLAAAKFQKNNLTFSLAAVSTKKQLLQRIAYFTSDKNNQKTKNPFAFLLVVVIGLLFCFSLTTSYFLSDFKQPSAKQILSIPFLKPTIDWVEKPISTVEKPKVFFTKPITTIVANNEAKPVINNNETESLAQIYPIEKIIPVVNKEVEEESKQIIIEEVQSGSNKPAVMMIYKVTKINGEWVLEPQMTVTKTINDSIRLKKDTSEILKGEQQ